MARGALGGKENLSHQTATFPQTATRLLSATKSATSSLMQDLKFQTVFRRTATFKAVSVAGLSRGSPEFDPRSFRVRYVVAKVSLRQVSLPVLQFSPVSIIPPMHHTHSFTYHPHCNVFLPVLQLSPLTIIPPLLHTHHNLNLLKKIRICVI